MAITLRAVSRNLRINAVSRNIRVGAVRAIYLPTPPSPLPSPSDSTINGAALNTFTLNG